MDSQLEVLDWNVRGLNDPAKRSAVREFLATLRVSLVCFQETKVAVIDQFFVMQCLGPSFDGFAYLPAVDTRGGILLAWDTSVLNITNLSFDTYAITGEVHTRDNNSWWVTTVYGPQSGQDKRAFIRELAERRSLCPGPWMVLGDFNLILNAREKNNSNIDRGLFSMFRSFVQEHELKDLYMHGRLYTWSNEREVPTLSRIDRVLVSVDWDLLNPDSILQALSSSISDHAPLHLALSAAPRPKKRFQFELCWTKLEGFQDAVKEAWRCDDSIVDPFKRLDALFRNAASFLQSWGQRKIGNIKLNIAIANVLIFWLDVAQERRPLSEGERWLRRTLKLLVLGLSSLERTVARQRSRIRWLKDGDANSRLFHLVANGRRAKNFVTAVRVGDETVTDQARKIQVFTEAYV
jgi:mannosylglycoprotein endo-beta-mannosidase